MNATWMESEWWEFTIVAVAAVVFTLWPWCLGSFGFARDVKHKDVPNWVAGFFFVSGADNCRTMDAPPNPKAGKLSSRIPKGIALLLGAVFLLGFEIHLWINVINDHATVERALLVQLTLFLPFLVLNFVSGYLFQRYLNRLPEREISSPPE